MSDHLGSSHDEGQRASSSDEPNPAKSNKGLESKMRESILSRLSKRKNSESDDDTTEQRFSIQPKNAQKAKEDRYRDKERDKKREKDKRDDRRDVRGPDARQKDRDFKGRQERSGRDQKVHEHRHHHHHRKHETDGHRTNRSNRDRSSERDSEKHKRHIDRHKKSSTTSPDNDKSPHKKSKHTDVPADAKLFDRILDPNYKKKDDDVLVIEDVEMSPIEILEEKEEKEIVEFTIDSPAGPKKYSKFESDPESDHDDTKPKSPGKAEDDDDVIEVLDDALHSDDDADSDEDKYLKTPEDREWEEMTETEQRLHKEAMKKRASMKQKTLIAQLPVFYPGLMGCRNIDEYECVNRVDEGTFGVVYRGKDKRTDEIVALKRLKMEKEKEGFPITALREINMLLKAGNHPNIVNVKEILLGSNMDKIYMAMEFVEHDMKSLLDTMSRRNKRFSIGEQKTLLQQLLSGIEHMHKLWILHRDLKTSNLLMSHKGILKIADFGLAREYGDPLKKFTSIVVTLWYRSPELLLGTRLYSTPVDMWSVGCIMAEFILLKPLFPGRGELEQIKKIFMEMGTPTESIWPGVTELDGWKALTFEKYPYNQLRKRFLAGRLLNDTGFKLLNGLLTLDPKNRFSATQALDHEWFTEEPYPVPPEEFPTFPAKSEQNKAPPPAKQKQQENRISHVDPETAKLLKQFEVRPEQVKPGGFSLKFDPTRF
ncbi:Cyclin-dependent kinase 11.1 [Caenorhabditis elegans]|uniref:Isoform b of Cyclin-dependent kinase 11.1 n=1 Tax=Caenorhabditis elegans TaxID=6239 RepID=Q09437-2|nr:Cyclin-dependent kinase 11.1 [Caenorhabditis elegans]SPC47283.1 Cyclin-dependent kinase 11.1 [Caenorhabditis elegans]|eukprot:NP_001348696.1 Cyclin-dependent kinase 11.1 [Caenorhabditis elegans]